MEQVIEGAVTWAVPLLLAALGGVIAERSGVLNIALEGLMLGGAFVSAWAAVTTGAWLAPLPVVAFGLAAGFVLSWVMVVWRADQVVVGIAFNLLMLGLTSYLYGVVTKVKGIATLTVAAAGTLPVPLLSRLPLFGTALFDQHILGYLAAALVVVIWAILFKTGLGLRVRASGEFSPGAMSVGVNVIRLRLIAFLASACLACLGGAYLVLADVHIFTPNMTLGRGYIALAAIILGRWSPVGVAGACLLFGLAESVQIRLQTMGLGIPVQIAFAFPYIVTLIAISIIGRAARAPAEEGRPLPPEVG